MLFRVSRHGKTDENVRKILSGQSDTARLSEEGEAHARHLVEIFGNDDIEAIFSSPLTRAIDTIAPLAKKLNLAILLRSELMEMNFGEMDRKFIEEAMPHIRKRDVDLSYKFPGGECYFDVVARADCVLDEIQGLGIEKPWISTHGGTSRAVLARLTKKDLSNPKNLTMIAQPNDIVYTIDTKSGLCTWQNTATLETGFGLKYVNY